MQYADMKAPTAAERQTPEYLLHVVEIKLRLATARGDAAKVAHWTRRADELRQQIGGQ